MKNSQEIPKINFEYMSIAAEKKQNIFDHKQNFFFNLCKCFSNELFECCQISNEFYFIHKFPAI